MPVRVPHVCQSWWTLLAFVISAGANELMEARIARIIVQRISQAMERIGALQALYDVVSAKQ